jgi:arabinose-5-phosphate isomerase
MSTSNLRHDSPAETRQAPDILSIARRILEAERDGLTTVLSELGPSFREAVERILATQGRVGVTGMGKAGLVGAKIAATLSSTGTAAYTLHPVEALHGDLGMVRAEDVILALSNSGESEEMDRIIPLLQRRGCCVILVTGRPRSRCGRKSDVVLSIGAQTEACPLGMAPSSSTTAMLAIGDALALTVMEVRGFAAEEYAAVHPGGALGRSLMLVEEIMRTGGNCPVVTLPGTVQDCAEAIERAPARAGAAIIVDADGILQGIFTQGDLTRLLSRAERPGQYPLAEVMTRNPKHVVIGDRVARAMEVIQRYGIDEVPVVDQQGRAKGLIDIQDLVARGFSLFDVA